MSFEDDGAAPHFKTHEERDEWQKRKYGEVRNGFREPGTMSDGRPVIRRNSDFQYLPAIQARRVATGDRWICPGCGYNYGMNAKECEACNIAEEKLWTESAGIVLRALGDKDFKPTELMAEIVHVATGRRPKPPIKDMPKETP